MKTFVTGVGGQLGHDVMNELNKRGYIGIGSDIKSEYSGITDRDKRYEKELDIEATQKRLRKV